MGGGVPVLVNSGGGDKMKSICISIEHHLIAYSDGENIYSIRYR